MKNNSKKMSPTSVMIAIVALIVAVSSTLAWFFIDREITVTNDFRISSFTTKAQIYFLKGTTRTEIDGFKNPDGTINVDFADDAALNYIGDLRAIVKVTGQGEQFIRVKMVHQFLKNGTNISQYNIKLPYIVATPYSNTDVGNAQKWYDNRNNDYCFYLATAVRRDSANGARDIPLITGFENSLFDPESFVGCTLKIAITVEGVQVNRYPQFWGITELPWPGATSRPSVVLT